MAANTLESIWLEEVIEKEPKKGEKVELERELTVDVEEQAKKEVEEQSKNEETVQDEREETVQDEHETPKRQRGQGALKRHNSWARQERRNYRKRLRSQGFFDE